MGKQLGRRLFRRSRSILEDNIKIDLRAIGCKDGR
jgi:hypothetical protein